MTEEPMLAMIRRGAKGAGIYAAVIFVTCMWTMLEVPDPRRWHAMERFLFLFGMVVVGFFSAISIKAEDKA